MFHSPLLIKICFPPGISGKKRTLIPFSKDESHHFPCYHLFSQYTHMHCLSRYFLSYLCTITGAPVASYPQPFSPAASEGSSKTYSCVLSSAPLILRQLSVASIHALLFLFLAVPYRYFMQEMSGCQAEKEDFGKTFRKYAAQFSPITFFTSSSDIPLCSSAAVSSGT